MIPFVEKYKPTRLSDFAGMARPRAVLEAVAKDPYSSAFMLVGAAGTGKTTMALAFADELGAQVIHIPSRECDLERVRTVCEHCRSIPMFARAPWYVVIVDEMDESTRAAQLAFLSKLDTTAAPPNTIFIFTANSTEKLEARLLSRMRILRFETDDLLEPGAALLARIWHQETGNGDGIDFAGKLQAAGMNLRAAIMDLEMDCLMNPHGLPVNPRWTCASCGETNDQAAGRYCEFCGRKRVTIQ